MIAPMLLSTVLAVQAAPARVPQFQPNLNFRLQPVRPGVRIVRHDNPMPEVVCGMPMVRKTPADDPKILLPARETGATIRRIEPDCGSRPSTRSK